MRRRPPQKRGRRTPISVLPVSVASYLIYTHVRLHIPMTHNDNDRPDFTLMVDVQYAFDDPRAVADMVKECVTLVIVMSHSDES